MFLFKSVPICEFGWNELNESSVKMTHFPNVLPLLASKWSKWVPKCSIFKLRSFNELKEDESNEPCVKMTHFSNIFTSTCIKAAEMGSKMFNFQVWVILWIERR